jgi:hypothetical protein
MDLHDIEADIAGDRRVARGTERIDVAAEPEAGFHEGLDARPGPAEAAIAEPQDAVARVEIAVDKRSPRRRAPPSVRAPRPEVRLKTLRLRAAARVAAAG